MNNKQYVLQFRIGMSNHWMDLKSHGNVISAGTINGVIAQVINAEFNPDEFHHHNYQIVSREIVTKDEVVS